MLGSRPSPQEHPCRSRRRAHEGKLVARLAPLQVGLVDVHEDAGTLAVELGECGGVLLERAVEDARELRGLRRGVVERLESHHGIGMATERGEERRGHGQIWLTFGGRVG